MDKLHVCCMSTIHILLHNLNIIPINIYFYVLFRFHFFLNKVNILRKVKNIILTINHIFFIIYERIYLSNIILDLKKKLGLYLTQTYDIINQNTIQREFSYSLYIRPTQNYHFF